MLAFTYSYIVVSNLVIARITYYTYMYRITYYTVSRIVQPCYRVSLAINVLSLTIAVSDRPARVADTFRSLLLMTKRAIQSWLPDP